MKWLIGLPVILLLVLAPDGAAAAESFSVRCEGGIPIRPYFATFDIDAKAVVFETSPSSVETNFGINAYSGEIISTEDEKIKFILPVPSGRIDLTFDRARKTMTWPGLDDDLFRPTLNHKCSVSPPRSILSFRLRDPILHPISVRCEHAGGNVYFTMDAASKQALYERGKEGRAYRGEVTDANQDEIKLLMNFDVPRHVVWNKTRQTITIEAVEGSASSPLSVTQCQEITPRTMIEFHRKSRR